MQRQYTVQVSSVQEMVYRTLRDKIVSMELKPGTIISTQEIADSMSVSRTPVREAFIRLQREELLDVAPQRLGGVKLEVADRPPWCPRSTWIECIKNDLFVKRLK